ncbi:MAG: DEAD/DEAH box helicase, partial [Lachnospiraceae bacterium]|nr:DEAD/DEAH box helicase [Candidatus Equihabitans merdae]
MSVEKLSGYLPDDITEEEYPGQLMEYVRISVRHLVEFILQHGDLDNRSGKLPDATAMQEGTRIHRKIQKSAGGDYRPEVTLKEQVTYCDAIISVEGRADGIFTAKRGDLLEQVEDTTPAIKLTSTTDDDVENEEDTDHQLSLADISEGIVKDLADNTPSNVPSEHVASDTAPELANENDSALYELDRDETLTVIDEIKGIEMDVDKLEAPRRLHLAQARCYAAIYAREMELDRVGVRITYVNLDFEDVRYFYQEYDTEENRLWFKNLIDEFHKWIAWQVAHRLELAESMKDLQFPFTYRKGQRHLVASVYQAIKDQQQLFVEAPTGVGKTMSMIYPSIRAMGEDKARRLFYLTAKNVTRQVANEAFHILESKGLRLKHVTITAKDKICPLLETDCNPDYCPYAKGHFDRINDAVFSLLNEADCYDAETILKKANEANVCPFELSLDVSSWADAIVGDYNYAFDPRAHLKRFFGDGISSQGILLIDEAHNLVDRGREMYSAVLSKKEILATKKAFKDKSRRVIRDLDKINRHLLQIRHLVEDQDKPYYRYTHTDGLDVEVTRLVTDMQHFFENDNTGTFQSVSEAYFAFRDFVDACDRMTDNYLLYAAIDEEEN